MEPDPAEVLVAWSNALEAGRPGDAWALLAPEAREGLDEAGFVALFERRREEMAAAARQLSRWVETHHPEERAIVSHGSRRFELARTRAGWRIVRLVEEDQGRVGH